MADVVHCSSSGSSLSGTCGTKRKDKESDEGKSRTKKMLKKSERTAIVRNIKDKATTDLAIELAAELDKDHTRFLAQNESLNTLWSSLKSANLLYHDLIEYHRSIFASLYEANGTGKEKYMRFQIEWYRYCSIFLLPTDVPINTIILDNLSQDLSKIQKAWFSFCEANSPTNWAPCNKIMIMFSSAIYSVLLKTVHDTTTQSVVTNPASVQLEDSDDVYFRFGGAAICEMLHVRYKQIKKCTESKREKLNSEIDILQAINTRDKSSMPSYLQERDKGHLYSPHADFIPFFRDVDNLVKVAVSKNGFEENGDQIVKVCYF